MRTWNTKQDNTAPLPSGILTAAEDNARGVEENNLVKSAGIALDSGSDTNLNMMAEAAARYASGGIIYGDTGAANVYVLAGILGANYFVMPKAYFTGMIVQFYPANTNNAATTVNVSGLGAKKVFTHTGAACAGGEIVANRCTAMQYDAALDSGTGAFKLFPWSNQLNIGAGGGGGGGGTSYSAGEGVAIDVSNHLNFNYPGLSTYGSTPDAADTWAFYHASTGHHLTLTTTQMLALFGATPKNTKALIGGIALSVSSGAVVTTGPTWTANRYASGDGVLDPNQTALGAGSVGTAIIYDNQKLTGVSVSVVSASTTGCTFDVTFTGSSFSAASDYRVVFNNLNSGGAVSGTPTISNKTASGFRASFTYIAAYPSMNFILNIYA